VTRTARATFASARWRPLSPLFRAFQMPEDPVHHLVLGDEGYDLHLTTARGALKRVDLVNPLDQLRPAPAERARICRTVAINPRRIGVLFYGAALLIFFLVALAA